MKTLICSTLLAAATATAATAGEIRLDAPLQAASLNATQADMSVYWIERAEGYEVVATYVAPAQGNEAQRLVMLLADGDATTFSLPGLSSTQYSFARSGTEVRAWTSPTWAQIASN